MSLKRKQPDEPTVSTTTTYRSNPIVDRSSTFVAVYSPSLPYKTLQSDPKFRDASHRIAAWRAPSKQKALFSTAPARFDTGSDDDGERYAGKHVAKVLDELDVVGAVVVVRWYGGVLLGPVRFEHIENVAREAVSRWKEAAQDAAKEESAKIEGEKRRKVEEAEKSRLVRELPERDASVVALRGLLAQKKEGNSASSAPTTPSKVIDYSKMPVEVLRKLEKTRDTTIAWLLKSIDEAEAKVKAARGEGSTIGDELSVTVSREAAEEEDALDELLRADSDSEPVLKNSDATVDRATNKPMNMAEPG